LYGCETWFLTLSEAHRLRFGPEREEVIACRRKLQDEQLHELHSSPSMGRVTESMRWAGHVALMGKKRYADRVLMRASE
jgi:hypothetical protein